MLLPLLAVVLSLSNPSLAQNCYYDYYGQYSCSGISYGARAGIGIAIAALIVIILACCAYTRRRRQRAINASFIPQQNSGINPGIPPQPQQPYSVNYNPGAGAWEGQNYAAPPPTYDAGNAQYPPKSYQGQYAPPTGPPPSNANYSTQNQPPLVRDG